LQGYLVISVEQLSEPDSGEGIRLGFCIVCKHRKRTKACKKIQKALEALKGKAFEPLYEA